MASRPVKRSRDLSAAAEGAFGEGDSLDVLSEKARALARINDEVIGEIVERESHSIVTGYRYAKSGPNVSVEKKCTAGIELLNGWKYDGEPMEIPENFFRISDDYDSKNYADVRRLHTEFMTAAQGIERLKDVPENRTASKTILNDLEILQVAIGQLHALVLDARDLISDDFLERFGDGDATVDFGFGIVQPRKPLPVFDAKELEIRFVRKETIATDYNNSEMTVFEGKDGKPTILIRISKRGYVLYDALSGDKLGYVHCALDLRYLNPWPFAFRHLDGDPRIIHGPVTVLGDVYVFRAEDGGTRDAELEKDYVTITFDSGAAGEIKDARFWRSTDFDGRTILKSADRKGRISPYTASYVDNVGHNKVLIYGQNYAVVWDASTEKIEKSLEGFSFDGGSLRWITDAINGNPTMAMITFDHRMFFADLETGRIREDVLGEEVRGDFTVARSSTGNIVILAIHDDGIWRFDVGSEGSHETKIFDIDGLWDIEIFLDESGRPNVASYRDRTLTVFK